jgi:enoyl-CoA hydratase/carnithine racemase
MSAALAQALAQAADRSRLADGKAIFLRAAGPVFCAGADLKNPDSDAVPAILALVRDSAVPWIACVEGPAVGAGAILAGSCLVTIASESASFLLSEIDRVGQFPIGVRWLMGVVAIRGLMRAALSGAPVSAEEASAIGWCTEHVPAGAFEERVGAWKDRLSGVDRDILVEAQATWARYLMTARGSISGSE